MTIEFTQPVDGYAQGARVSTLPAVKEAAYVSGGYAVYSQSATSISGHSVSVEAFGVVAGPTASTSANDTAMAAAIAWANANSPCRLTMLDNLYVFGAVWPVITAPVHIQGAGLGQTWVYFKSTATGVCVTFRNTGLGAEAGPLGSTDSVAFTISPYNLSSLKPGPAITNLTLCGDRTAASTQHALAFEQNCDFIHVDVDAMYFNGRALWLGKASSNIRGNIREASKIKVRARNCGASGVSSVFWELTDSSASPGFDSSNMCKDVQFEVVYPYGMAIEFRDNRTTNNSAGIYGISGNFTVHGRRTGSTNVGPLVGFYGEISGCDFKINCAYQAANEWLVECDSNATLTTYPNHLKLDLYMPQAVKGVHLVHGHDIRIDSKYAFLKKEFVYCEDTLEGPVHITQEHDSQFLQLTANLVQNGLNPVTITGWNFAMAYQGASHMSAFFPAYATNGTGDTCKIVFDLGSGTIVSGTLTRSGSIGASTDTYTFTPDVTSTATIPSGTWASKVYSKSWQTPILAGRHLYKPRYRYGVTTV